LSDKNQQNAIPPRNPDICCCSASEMIFFSCYQRYKFFQRYHSHEIKAENKEKNAPDEADVIIRVDA